MLIFAGDGGRTPTGAAEGRAPRTAGDTGGSAAADTAEPGTSGTNPYLAVRTRQSLADLINSNEGLVEVKVEEQEEMECGGEDNAVILMERDFSDDSYDGDGMEEIDERILQSDYDEQDEGDDEDSGKEGEDGQEGDEQLGGGSGPVEGEVEEAGEVGASEPAAEATGHEDGGQEEGGQEDVEKSEGEPKVDNVVEGEERRVDPKEKEEVKGGSRRKKGGAGADLIVEEPKGERPTFQPDGMYYAVKQVLKGAVNGFPLNKRFKDESDPDPGFRQPGDERWGRNFNQFKLSKARIVSCSLDTSTGTCKTCLSGEHEAWMSADGGPIVVVLSDQHFPANVPADGPGECLRIIRVENGTLNELADELVRKAPSKGLPAGSVILLLSASQLYYESVEYYAAEWSRCRNWIRADLGEVLVLPGLPLTGNGIYSETAVRGLLDFYAWIGRLEEPELKLIRNTRLAWADVYLGKMERGGGWADPRINIRLPVSLREGAGTTPSFGGGGGRGQRSLQH
jgi:hypothetical protein